jgi:broad specificity phosphatase PhoE
MPNLILIKHSMPDLVPTMRPNQWHLSAEGQARCRSLAERLAPYAPQALYTSDEVKAMETGRLIGPALGLAPTEHPNVHENEREGVDFPEWSVIENGIRQFYAVPDRIVFGSESADHAYERFDAALQALLGVHPDQTVAVVTHGTVIANWVARKTRTDPYDLWKRLSPPGFVVLSRPDLQLVAVVDKAF